MSGGIMKNSVRYIYLCIVLCLMSLNTSFAAIINVPAVEPTIQSGIDVARDGDTVLVAEGIYEGKGNVNVDFRGKQITVKSIGGAEKTIIDCGEVQDTRGFLFNSGETNATMLDGFTIKNGVHKEGAGLFINNASPTIRNCIITDNKSGDSANYSGRGGGIYCFNSDAFIEGCTITRNFVGSRFGGGVYLAGKIGFGKTRLKPILLNCTISENTGHGVYSEDSVIIEVRGCTVSKNSIRGIVCTSNYSRTANLITNSRIEQNMDGGVYVSTESGLKITESIIRKNRSRFGAGIYCNRTSTLEVSNCVIADNIAESFGGGLYIASYVDRTITISHTTVTGNTAGRIGGGIYFDSTPSENLLRLTVTNCIIWGNHSDGNNHELALAGNSVLIKSSDIRGGLEGTGREAEPNRLTYVDNIDEDPLFIDPDNGDFRLMENSPAFSMGAHAAFAVAGTLSVTPKGKRISTWAEFKHR